VHVFITHSYAGTLQGKYRCIFYYLLEDDVEAQSTFVRELDLQLEEMGRHLKDSAAVVRPFSRDIEAARQHVLSKHWTTEELERVSDTPGLLMINVDFDAFDPRAHSWLHLGFGGAVRTGTTPAAEYSALLGALANAIRRTNEDVFKVARSVIQEAGLKDAAEVFEAKPGILGISIDLEEGAALLDKLWQRLIA